MGLGVADLDCKNRALLAKWYFRFGNEENSIWRRVVAEKNGWPSADIFPGKVDVRKCSRIWRNIDACAHGNDKKNIRLRKGFGVCLGNSKRIKFWTDEWCEGVIMKSKFPRVYALVVKKEGRVADFGTWDGQVWKWTIELRKNIFDWELLQWQEFWRTINLQCPDPEGEDKLIWKPITNAVFSISSAMKTIRGELNYMEQIWREIWRGIAPPKIEVFMWQLMVGRLPVRKAFMERNMLERQEANCCLCDGEVEFCKHLFFECRLSWRIWMEICNVWNIVWVMSGHPQEIMLSWNELRVESSDRETWRLIFFVVCWTIWLGRNDIIFEGKKVEDINRRDLISLRLASWLEAKWPSRDTATIDNSSRGVSGNHGHKVQRDGEEVWSCPSSGYLKFNVDGATDRLNGYSGIGGVLRDHTGNTKVMFSASVEVKDPTWAEFLAICEAFSIFAKLKWNVDGNGLIIETDSTIAHWWATEPTKCHWRLAGKTKELERNKARIKSWKIIKIGRSTNDKADALAKAGIRRNLSLLDIFD